MFGKLSAKTGKMIASAVMAVVCCLLFSACSAKTENKEQTAAPAVTTAQNLNSGSNFVASRTESYVEDNLPDNTESKTSQTSESKVTTSVNQSNSAPQSSSASPTVSDSVSSSKTNVSTPASSATDGQSSTVTSTTSEKETVTEQIVVELPESVDNSELLLAGLSEDIRYVYNRITAAIDDHRDEVRFDYEEIPQTWVEKCLLLISFTRLDDTALSSRYIVSVDGTGYVTKLKLEYTKSSSEAEKQKKQLADTVREIAAGCPVSDEYGIVEYIHDEIVKRCTYDPEGENILSAYGCLVEGKAVCEGYAKAFTLLCGELGIECVPVIGTTSGSAGAQEAHMWNLAKIEGKWYHFDPTWDDPITDLGDDFVKYDYFGLSDEKISADHVISEIPFFEYPSAYSENGGYFYRNKLSASTAERAKEILLNEIVSAVSSDKRFVRVQVTDNKEFEKLTAMLFETNETGTKEIFRLLSQAYDAAGNESFNPRRYSKLPYSEKNVITIVLNYEEN